MTWDSSEGVYRGNLKTVGIAENVAFGGPFVKGRNPQNILLHEMGHSFDDANDISNKTKFLLAYNLDVKKIKSLNRQRNVKYYLQSGAAGKRETAAELFSNVLNGSLSDKELKRFFPRSFAYIQRFMKDLK